MKKCECPHHNQACLVMHINGPCDIDTASCKPCCQEPAEERECPLSKRVDGKYHSWVFDGDDPYVICHYCKERRDAISGEKIGVNFCQPTKQEGRNCGGHMFENDSCEVCQPLGPEIDLEPQPEWEKIIDGYAVDGVWDKDVVKDFIRQLLQREREKAIKECTETWRELWLEGIDHPYDTQSYNSALKHYRQKIYSLKHNPQNS